MRSIFGVFSSKMCTKCTIAVCAVLLQSSMLTAQEPSLPGPIETFDPISGDNTPGPFRHGEINPELVLSLIHISEPTRPY